MRGLLEAGHVCMQSYQAEAAASEATFTDDTAPDQHAEDSIFYYSQGTKYR